MISTNILRLNLEDISVSYEAMWDTTVNKWTNGQTDKPSTSFAYMYSCESFQHISVVTTGLTCDEW